MSASSALEWWRRGCDAALSQRRLMVSIACQQLAFCVDGELVKLYPVSTAERGVGGEEGSYKTPPGLHAIAEKIGAGAACGELFVGRVAQGEQVAIIHEPRRGERDSITSRILWLEGLEPGLNQGPGCDSYQRYIYIHGTAEEGLIGTPVSIGCIRMKNRDVIELFEQVEIGDQIEIIADT